MHRRSWRPLLSRIQPDHDYLWGGEAVQGSVLACDFYNAGSVATLSDEDIISLMIDDMIPKAVPAFKAAKVGGGGRMFYTQA